MIADSSWMTIVQSFLPGYSLVGTLAGTVLLVCFYTLYSGAETGLYRVNRLRLHLACRGGNRRALVLDHLLDHPQVLISVFVIGANVCGYLIASLITGYMTRQGYSTGQIEFWSATILTPVFAIVCETLPKNCFYAQTNRMMLWIAPFIHVSYLIMRYTGLTFVVAFFSRLAFRIAHRLGRSVPPAQEWDDLELLLRESLAAGPLSEIQGGMAERLIGLTELPLTGVIIPLAQTVALPMNLSREEFIAEVRKHPYSRFPLYDGHPRNIVGIVSIYQDLTSPTEKPPRDFLRSVPKIRMEEKLLTALTMLREFSVRIAVVTDRAGSAIGIVTIRDLLDQVFGNSE